MVVRRWYRVLGLRRRRACTAQLQDEPLSSRMTLATCRAAATVPKAPDSSKPDWLVAPGPRSCCQAAS